MARLSRGSRWFLAFLGVMLVAAAGALYVIDGQLGPIGGPDVEPGLAVTIEVPQGASVASVGERLAEEGVITSTFRFRTTAEEAGLASVLQPGTFELETLMGHDAAIAVLAEGPVGGVGTRFTVQEGLTVEQTLVRLEEQFDDLTAEDLRAVLDERTAAGENADGVLQLPAWVPEPAEAGDEVLEPYEGLLFPQTYDVAADATALTVLQRMVDELGATADAIDPDALDALEARGLDRYDGLILSSLIERETRVDDERELVSGVIENRLVDGMRLQIDATALYASGEPTDQVADIDTSIDSPYNTYEIDGLPPTPISGVGVASFGAAYRPGDTSAMFYVLAPECDGTHRFADTFAEHEANVLAFREAGRCAVELDG